MIAVWLVLLLAGFAEIQRQASRPGKPSNPPKLWPWQSSLTPSESLPTLVMMIHPQCPCSRSSLEELARLMVLCQGKVKAHVVMLSPSGINDDWTSTPQWEMAEAIPQAVIHPDVDAREASLFRVLTSGDTVLYNARGELIFHGGLTPSRNRAGESPALEAIPRLLLRGTREVERTPVFGCALFSSRSEAAKGEAVWRR